MSNRRALVTQLKEASQDHEFYPTTSEIIAALVKDLRRIKEDQHRYGFRHGTESLLDIGAGDGKVLLALRDAGLGFDKLHAIEKSDLLTGRMPEDIFVVGTSFEEQSLLTKKVHVVFSNPPYSIYEDWTVKIIRECAAPLAYLVIPERWAGCQRILDALAYRGVKLPGERETKVDKELRGDWRCRAPKDRRLKVVGSFDFRSSEDRAARAKVQLLRIELPGEPDDAFERFFNTEFAGLVGQFNQDEQQVDKVKAGYIREEESREKKFGPITVGEDYPAVMVRLYMDEMAQIRRNYELVAGLDAGMLRELKVYPAAIMAALRERMAGLKQLYWSELFNNLSALTDRLTHASRKCLLGTLQANVHVDFTVDNIRAVVLWAIKNANRFIDRQLIQTYELMVDKCNVKLYKSNQRPFVYDRWRYKEENSTHYYLEYRIVMHSCGGIRNTEYSFEKGLEERARVFLDDLRTIARNLGFMPYTDWRTHWQRRDEWVAGKLEVFSYHLPGPSEGTSVGRDTLFEVRAFKNGNMHLRLNQDFMLALNVEHGRLKGWIKNAVEAAQELQEPKAMRKWKTNHRLLPSTNGAPALKWVA